MTGPISREVREIIAGELDMPVAKLSDSASFREDLGAGFPDDHRIE
jgi:acyl carrier protein